MEIVRLPKVKVDAPTWVPSGLPQVGGLTQAGCGSARSERVRRLKMNAPPRSTTEFLQAPIHLVSETRAAFRTSALAYVERLGAEDASVATVNLGETLEIDASGLGILVLLQKRSKELGMTLRLAQVPSKVRYLLVLTKLDHLFEIVD